MNHKLFCEILNSGMEVATGCTEPAAVALCAAYASEQLTGEVAELSVSASVNIIKNAMAAGIPGITYTGTEYAAALGAIGGKSKRQLQVIDTASSEECRKAIELVQGGHVKISKKDAPPKFYIEVEIKSVSGHQARAIIASSHTNLIYLEKDGVAIINREINMEVNGHGPLTDAFYDTLSIETIYDFVSSLDREKDDLHIIEQAISVNKCISREGAEKKFGLHVGQNIAAAKRASKMNSDVVTTAMELTACGIDARMGGANVPVVTNSGSGNQGITATIPVVTAAEFLGIDEDRMFRAVTLSHLMTLYIHRHFGLLSALCGATVAGTGASCGLVYLFGGSPKQIGYAINNMVGSVAGMLCDGAKANCALKVATCVNTAFLSAYMAIDNISVQPNEGIVEGEPAQTIRNFVRIGNDVSPLMDNVILDIVLNKQA
ncbi:MAG: L-serine ammonia-lyase, iron-sulfur-dependent, subunit alpha [Anaerovoracaceae bacterium]